MRASAFVFLGGPRGYFHKKQASRYLQGGLCGHKSVFIVIIGIPAKAQAHVNHASTRLAYLISAIFAWMPFINIGGVVSLSHVTF